MTGAEFDLVAVGHIVNETIYFPDRTIGPVLGSPPAYSLVASARQGIRTGIVTKIGDDFPAELLRPFEVAGIDTRGVINCGESTCSQLIYDSQGNKEIRFPSRADFITAADVPQTYRGCRMMYVCTMEDDIPLNELAEVASFGQSSAIDIGGYGGVHMGKERRGEIDDTCEFALEAAEHFDFVKASDEDCRMILGEATPLDYARQLLQGRAKASLITMGSKGALVGIPEGYWHVPPLKGKPVDATGGGDTFMGGFLCEFIRSGDVLTSAVFGSATALCVIEKTGGVSPERMPTYEEVKRRIPQDIMGRIVKL